MAAVIRELAPRPQSAAERKLWHQCCAMEGVFLGRMLEAMEKTAAGVDGLFGNSAGLKMTRQMLSEKLSEEMGQRGTAGIAADLYRDLARRLVESTAAGAAEGTDNG